LGVRVTSPNPLRFEALILIKSWDETDRISPKTGDFLGLKPYKLSLQTKITVDSHTTLRPHIEVHNSMGHTPGVLIPAHIKKFTRRHTTLNLQTTTPTQVVGSHGFTERLAQYITQALTYLNYVSSNEDIMQHLKTLIFKYMYIASQKPRT